MAGTFEDIKSLGDSVVNTYSDAWSLAGDIVSSPLNMLSSTVASVFGGLASIIVLGVGVYVLFTLIIGKFQFYIGFLFGPLALVFLPLDKGRVLSACISMMLAGITVFAVSFAVLLVSVDIFGKAAAKLSEVAIANGEGGGYKIMFSIASMLYAWIMYLVVKSSVSWGSELFGSFGFDMRSIAQGIGGVGNKASGMGNSGAGAAIGAGGRGVAGGVGGAIAGGNKGAIANAGGVGGAAMGRLQGALSGSAQGFSKAARGRGGDLSKKAPSVGSGLRMSDSFNTGMGAVQSGGKSKVSSASSELLNKK